MPEVHAIVTRVFYTTGFPYRPSQRESLVYSRIHHPVRTRALVVASLFAGTLAACGGGSDPAAVTAPAPAPAPPSNTRWISSAAQTDLGGAADSGIDGVLLAVDPARPVSPAAVLPSRVDSTAVRVLGGVVDTTRGSLSDPAPRFVVYDAQVNAGSPQSFALYKLPLDAAGTDAPVPQRLSNQVTMCAALGARFSLVGQSLAGDEALITFAAPDNAGSCAAGGVPMLARLSMSANAVPVSLPVAVNERITPVGVIHGSAGQIAAVFAWQDGRFVRTDANMSAPTPLPAASVAGTVDAGSAPIAAGVVTRNGIFVKSADGLRRYDKASGKLSAPLLTGQVGQGAQFNEFFDDQALYVTRVAANGDLELFRVEDAASPSVIKINTDGPLHPWGFRVLKSYVVYAVDGRNDFNVWRKVDGARTNVLAGKRIVLASSLHDRVFHTTTDPSGAEILASSLIDGSAERSLGVARLVSGALALQNTAFARTLRANAGFSHAVVVVPPAGQSSLVGATVRWLGFDDAVADIDAGVLPSTLALGAAVQAPGVVGDAGLFTVSKTGTADAYLFVSRRAAGSLARVANGVQ